MALTRKVLWIWRHDAHETTYRQHIEAAGIDTVCINTMSRKFPDLIRTYRDLNKTVWAWRWPGVEESDEYGWHYYAPDQARFVADLFKNHGLQGFIADPESNDNHRPNDWNQTTVNGIKTSDLAKNFWAVIKAGAQGRNVHIGLTSGWNFPDLVDQKKYLPWNEFAAPVDAVYPQTYWRIEGDDGIVERWHGDPKKGAHECLQYWNKFGKPIIPMAGEIALVTKQEIAKYGEALQSMEITEAHFYDDTPEVKPEVLAAIKALN